MKGQAGFWDFEHSLEALSAEGNPFKQKAIALDGLFQRLDQAISEAGFLVMGGQIIDVTLVAAPKQRNRDGEKDAIKAVAIPKA